MAKISFPLVLFLCSAVLLFSGCPDYSHQRPVPDYKNMVDGGGDSGNGKAVK